MTNADERKQFHKDNKGSAMALVIVIIAFIAILASVLMFAAYAGYRMRLVDEQGKDNFYTAEMVLDEINVGLQREVSQSLSAAYEDIMMNYSLEGSGSERNQRFREKYFEQLREHLQDSTDPTKYDIDLLRSYLTEQSLGDVGHGADGSRKAFEEDGVSYGAIVESDIGTSDADGASYLMEYNNTRLLLKDLRVSYVNKSGYVSIISTDIRIDLPDFTFAQAAAMPALTTCSLIADDTLFLVNTTEGGGITIKGDAYAGQMIIGNPSETILGQADGTVPSAVDGSKKVRPDTGMLSPASCAVTLENLESAEETDLASLLISRSNIELSAGSSLSVAQEGGAKDKVELWAQNMRLRSAEIDLDGLINLKDDLTLAGKESRATLAGEYSGFGYPGEDSGGEEDADAYASPDASSAIVINGQDTTLDLSGLDRLTISGRAYVAAAADAGRNPAQSTEEAGNKKNIMMGESVAVKSNQLIYMVPSEALGCEIEKDGTIGDSVYNCNPLTMEQYQEIITNPDKFVFLDGSREISALGNKKLSEYIDQETVAGGESAYVPEIVFKHTNAGPLVYCYLRFSDEDAANRYFRDYYSLNSQSVDRYTELYAKDIKMSPDTLLYLNMAGNMLVQEEGGGAWSVVGAEASTGNSQQLEDAAKLKNDVFNSLSVKLVRTSNQLTSAEKSRTAFSNIVSEIELENVLSATGKDGVPIETPDGTCSIVLTTGQVPDGEGGMTDQPYRVDSSTPDNVKIVISLGDVEVERNFDGIIIAKGNITVAAGASLTVEPIDVNDFSKILLTKVDELTETQANGEEVYYYLTNIFADGTSYAYSGNAAFDAGSSRVSMTDLISYERWTKK